MQLRFDREDTVVRHHAGEIDEYACLCCSFERLCCGGDHLPNAALQIGSDADLYQTPCAPCEQAAAEGTPHQRMLCRCAGDDERTIPAGCLLKQRSKTALLVR